VRAAGSGARTGTFEAASGGMMKITDRLKVEHGVFLMQLRHLEQMIVGRAPAVAVAAAMETIAQAESHHSALEDRLLYPALAQRLGTDSAPLREVRADHQRIEQLLDKIRAGDTDAQTILELVGVLRDHMEREIHQVFTLAESVLSEGELSSMCNWDVQHIFEESGNEALWMERLAPLPKTGPASG
jgi:hemerythrin-like domain-containing protein